MLSQVADKPTCTAESGVENTIDLVLTNSEESIREVETLDTSLSDHKYVTIILSDCFQGPKLKKNINNILAPGSSDVTEVSFSSLNFHKADFEKINRELEEVDWDTLKAESTHEVFPELFYKKLLTIFQRNTPLKRYSKKEKSKYSAVCRVINRKRRKVKARLRALQHLLPSSRRLPSLQSKLIALEKEAQRKIIECKQIEEKKALEAMRTNPKYFFSYAKERNITKTRIGPLRDSSQHSNNFVDDPKTMADTNNKQQKYFYIAPRTPYQ